MTTAAGTRTWTVSIPAPVPMRSSNERDNRWAVSRDRRAWRDSAFGRIALARLPKGLGRIRVEVELRFTTVRRRDAPNYYAEVIKPCVDALTPEKRVQTKNGIRIERGWGVIPDDNAKFLDLAAPRIGDPVSKGQHPHGLVVLTITDLTGDPR